MGDRTVFVSDANDTLYKLDFSPVVLPTHDEADLALKNGLPTKLEEFIYHQEPAGENGEEFRSQLTAALGEFLRSRLQIAGDHPQ